MNKTTYRAYRTHLNPYVGPAAMIFAASMGLQTLMGCYTAPADVDSFQLSGYSTERREFELEAGVPVRIRYRSYFPVRYKYLHPESGTELGAGVSAELNKIYTPRFSGTYIFQFQPVNRQPALVQLHPPTPTDEDIAQDRP